MTSPRDSRRGPPRAALWAAGGLGLLVVLALVALIDAHGSRNRVQRNVVVAGENVGKMGDADLDSFLNQLEGRYRTMNVSIVPPEGAFNVSGGNASRASLWQAGFHDRAIRSDEDLLVVARYVVANPLRAKLVDRLGDYPFWNSVWL